MCITHFLAQGGEQRASGGGGVIWEKLAPKPPEANAGGSMITQFAQGLLKQKEITENDAASQRSMKSVWDLRYNEFI